jgi:hypothetical protein
VPELVNVSIVFPGAAGGVVTVAPGAEPGYFGVGIDNITLPDPPDPPVKLSVELVPEPVLAFVQKSNTNDPPAPPPPVLVPPAVPGVQF